MGGASCVCHIDGRKTRTENRLERSRALKGLILSRRRLHLGTPVLDVHDGAVADGRVQHPFLDTVVCFLDTPVSHIWAGH